MQNYFSKNKILVSPSLLSADFAQIGQQCQLLLQNGADFLHCDVMDGVFVPNITFGIPVVRDIRKFCDGFLDVHLMIDSPQRYLKQFAQAGADLLTFHIEATDDVQNCIQIVKECGKFCGISIKPNTAVEEVFPYLDMVDMVLVMSVEPGFGGQSFMPLALEKLTAIRQKNSKIALQVDGGITLQNVQQVIDSGANIIVAGTTVFNSPNMAETIQKLRGK